MGDEFIATLATPDPPLKDIVNLLCETKRYTVERCSEAEANLRLASKSRCPDWPEDFLLACHERGLYLLIHQATKQEQDLLLADLTAVLKNLGVNASFDVI